MFGKTIFFQYPLGIDWTISLKISKEGKFWLLFTIFFVTCKTTDVQVFKNWN